jgi:hypothetical protein
MAAKDIEAGRAHVLVTIRDRMTQGFKAAEQKLKNFGAMVATSAGVITAGGAASLAWPLKLSANMEQTKVSFETMLKSADKAKELLGDLNKFAEDTPFQFPEIADAAKKLLAFKSSASNVKSELEMLGNISSGIGDPIGEIAELYGKARVQGRLFATDMNQFMNRGIDITTSLAQQFRVAETDVSKLVEEGKVGFPQLDKALRSLTTGNGQFAGGMEKQSRTLIGLISTLMDNLGAAARVMGDSLLEPMKTIARVGIAITKVIAGWIEKNKALVGTVAAIIAGVVTVGAGFVALGVAAMSASFVLGLVASGFSAIAAVIGFVFSPMGALVGVLIGLGVAAYAFRGSIAASFGSLLAWFGPVYDSLLQLGALFSGTITGIIDALSAGNIETAGNIAWAGLLAITFTATSSLIDMVVSMLGTVGQAIMSGNWGLAASIAMLSVQIQIVRVWNEIASLWDAAVMALSIVFDRVITAIPESFRQAGYKIAETITWLMGKFGELLGMKDNFMTKLSAEIATMNKQETGDAQRQQQKRDEQKMAAFNAKEQNRGAGVSAMEQQLAGLNAQAAAGYGAAGSPTGESMAAEARKKLDYALAAAQEEQAKAKAKGAEVKSGSQMAGVAVDATAKKATAGTFSAVAAGLLGTSRSDAANQTARNTAKMVSIMQKPTATPKAVMAP